MFENSVLDQGALIDGKVEQADAILQGWFDRLGIVPPCAERSEEVTQIFDDFVRLFYSTGEDCGVVEIFVFDDGANGYLRGQPGGFLWTFDEDGNTIVAICISKKTLDAGASEAVAVLIHQLAHVIMLRTKHSKLFFRIRNELRQKWENNTGLALSHEDMEPHIELGQIMEWERA